MATKPNSCLKNTRPSSSSSNSSLQRSSNASNPARPCQKTSPLSGGIDTTPPAVMKAEPNYLKPKASASYDHPIQSLSALPAIKIASGKRLGEKSASLPSTPGSQRSLKPASPSAKPRNSPRANGEKAARTVSRTSRTSCLVSKGKSTTPLPEKKMDAFQESEICIEKAEEEQSRTNSKKAVQVINDQKKAEGSSTISSSIEEKSRIGEKKRGCQLLNRGKALASREPSRNDAVPKWAVARQAVKKEVRRQRENADKAARRANPKPVESAPAVSKKNEPRGNDEIEEAESKLMETKKTNVLALVGAFETLMSQQGQESQQIQRKYQGQSKHQVLQCQTVEQIVECLKCKQTGEGQQNHEQEDGNSKVSQDQQMQENALLEKKQEEEEGVGGGGGGGESNHVLKENQGKGGDGGGESNHLLKENQEKGGEEDGDSGGGERNELLKEEEKGGGGQSNHVLNEKLEKGGEGGGERNEFLNEEQEGERGRGGGDGEGEGRGGGGRGGGEGGDGNGGEMAMEAGEEVMAALVKDYEGDGGEMAMESGEEVMAALVKNDEGDKALQTSSNGDKESVDTKEM